MTEDFGDFGDFEEFEGFDEAGDLPPAEASNRTFLLAAIGLGGLFVIGLVLIGLYAFLIVPRQRANRVSQEATVVAQNTELAIAVAQTQEAAGATPTSPAGAAAAATETPVVRPTSTATSPPTSTFTSAPPTNTPLVTSTTDPRTATAQARATITGTPPTATPTGLPGLPDTGLFDDLGGLPAMILTGLLLVVIVVVARQLRLRGAR